MKGTNYMVENIIVAVMVGLALAGGIFVWWIDNHNNKQGTPDENVHTDIKERGKLKNAKD